MNKYISILFILLISPLLYAGADFFAEQASAESRYKACYEALLAKAKQGTEDPNLRGDKRWSNKLKLMIEDCREKERLRDDAAALIALSKDIRDLYKNLPASEKNIIREEADDIASVIISATRILDKKFDMLPSAYWQNIFIYMNLRKMGYCYHWVEGLISAMGGKKYKYFERSWGVHDKDTPTENNSLIIAPRGQGLKSGLVYDAWRGGGKPFWRSVSADTQDWQVRFNEKEIFSGAAFP